MTDRDEYEPAATPLSDADAPSREIDVVQRARQALDAWEKHVVFEPTLMPGVGECIDIIADLLGLVEVALPTITAQRDDALAEVASVRRELAKALPDTTIRHKGDTARAIAHLTAERDTARILAQQLEDNSAALDRARTFIDKQVAVSEAHLDSDDHNIAAIADATLGLLCRIDQALDGKARP